MSAKKRTTHKSSKGPLDEIAAAEPETKVQARDNSSQGPAALDPQVRHQMIARAAYCRAEQRGFAGGTNSQFHDWLEAEAESDRMILQRRYAGSEISTEEYEELKAKLERDTKPAQ